jgi:hypothetical protein
MQESILDQFKEQLAGYLNTSGKVVVPLGVTLQLVGVAAIIRIFLRDNNIRLIGWLKALALATLFIIGAPVVSQAVSAVVVWAVPWVLDHLDPLIVIARFSAVDDSVAGVSRPWGYLLTIFATGVFIYRHIKVKNFGRRPSLKEYAYFVGVFLFLHVVLQLLCYVVIQMFH